MARGFRPVDRDQQFLVPPDMREWLPAGHVVWAVIDAVGLLDTAAFRQRYQLGGVGRAGYDPEMLLTLLFYAYSQGVRSSRQVERLCWQDVAYRIICAQDVPDHTTIWRFMDCAPGAVEDLFAQVLQLCAKAGMVQLGTITLDGMKIGANASKKANRSEEQLRAELAKLAARTVAEHRATDEQEALFDVPDGQQLPQQLVDPRSRAVRLRQALTQLEQAKVAQRAEREAKARDYLARQRAGERVGRSPAGAKVEAAQLRLQRARAEQQAKIEEYAAREAAHLAATGKTLPDGHPPLAVEEHYVVRRAVAALAKAEAELAEWETKQQAKTRNTTDPDSRLMPTRNGFIQGYNAQNVATEDGFLLATELTTEPNDIQQAIPMMRQAEHAAAMVDAVHATQAEAAETECTCPTNQQTPPQPRPACPRHPGGIGTLLADAGYHSRDNLTAPGPDRLIAPGKTRDVEKAARDVQTAPPPNTPPDDPDQDEPQDALVRNADRLRTPEGIATYRHRSHIAETPHGHIKKNLGFTTLLRRGLNRASVEWTFIGAVYNLTKLLRTLAKTATSLPTTA